MKGCNNCLYRKKTVDAGIWKIICLKTNKQLGEGTWGFHSDGHFDNYCACDGEYYEANGTSNKF